MKETLKCIYLSFDSTAIGIRERASISMSELPDFLQYLLNANFAREFLVVSTCNRTEVYYLSGHDLKEAFVAHLCCFKNEISISEISKHFKVELNSEKATKRLFRVGNGLLSQVVGDFQVIRQLKDAYECATQVGCAGSYLHRLLQLVFASHKDVSTYTDFHSGCASVSSVAADLIRKFASNPLDRNILVVGAGLFSHQVIEQLYKKGFRNITITNRHKEKAQAIAEKFAIHCTGLDVLQNIDVYDVIVTCVTAPEMLITKKVLSDLSSPRLLVDLSVPRAIDPDLAGNPMIRLFNLDHVKEENDHAIRTRHDALPKARKIINAYCEEFKEWEISTMARPFLNTFKNTMEKIRSEEVNRFLKSSGNLNANELVDMVTRSIINKIVKSPAIRLNEMSSGNLIERDKLGEALVKLFTLEVTAPMVEQE